MLQPGTSFRGGVELATPDEHISGGAAAHGGSPTCDVRRRRQTVDLPRGDETVLLVDDEELVIDSVSRILRGQGYTVLEARNAGDALRLLQTHGSDIRLMMTDLMMPGMSGWDLLARCREILPHLRVIVMSAAVEDMRAELRAQGRCVQVVQKPFFVKDLLVRIRSVLDA